MSLLPLIFSAWWADLERPHRIFDQNFGVGLYPDQLMLPHVMDRYQPSLRDREALELFLRPWTDLVHRGNGGSSTITADKDTFKVILDVQQFKPEEVNVKVVDKFVVVEAKHEEKRDEHGLISRQFVRKYLLPEQVDIDQLTSTISSDGVLTIQAPVKQIEEKANERKIKIEYTGKPAIRTTTKESTTEKTTKEDSGEEVVVQTEDTTTPEK